MMNMNEAVELLNQKYSDATNNKSCSEDAIRLLFF